MKKTVQLTSILFLIFAGLGGAYFYRSQSNLSQGVLRSAPQWTLKDSAGRSHQLQDLRGKAVVIHFWASWCPPCLDEIPNWIEFARRFKNDLKNESVAFVAISLDSNWKDALKVLADAQVPTNMISVLDESSKIPEDYGTFQFPETYLLNTQHEIVTKWVGPQNWKSPSIDAQIDAAIHVAPHTAAGK